MSNDLTWTKSLMDSTNYKQRFFAEYWQTKIRYEKLKNFCDKIEAARIMHLAEPVHDVPEKVLRAQQKAMGEYLHVLEVRAIIENVDLETTILNVDQSNDSDDLK